MSLAKRRRRPSFRKSRLGLPATFAGGSFGSPEELKTGALKALHNHELAAASGPLDETELLTRARALLPTRQNASGGGASLALAVAGGPLQQVLRPSELQSTELQRDIQREALFGNHSILDPTNGTNPTVGGNSLTIDQQNARLTLDSTGSLCIVQPAVRYRTQGQVAIPSIIEEEIAGALAAAVGFAASALDRIDPVRRITDVVPIVALTGANASDDPLTQQRPISAIA